MYFLYILKSEAKNWHYIGITKNIAKRVAKHNAGGVRSTKPHRPLLLIYQETFPNLISARAREIFLKNTAKARNELFERLQKLLSSRLV